MTTATAALKQELASLHSWAKGADLAYYALTKKSEDAIRDRLAVKLHRRLEEVGLLVAREVSLESKETGQYADSASKHIEHITSSPLLSSLASRVKGKKGELGGSIASKGPIDLAVLDSVSGKIKLAIELKAMYSFDWKQKPGPSQLENGMRRGIELDLLRTRCITEALELQPAAGFVIVLVFDVQSAVPAATSTSGSRRALRKYGLSKILGKQPERTTVRDELDVYFEKSIWGDTGLAGGRVLLREHNIKCGEAFGLSVSLDFWCLQLS